MVKTGISIKEWLSLMAIILPLLPICIIAIRKTYWHNVSRLLIAICLLYFLPALFITALPLTPANASFMNATASMIRLIAFFLLFRTVIHQRSLQELLNILITAFLSIAITVYMLKGVDNAIADISLAESAVMIAAIILVFIQLLNDQAMFIFDMPIFWIAAGTLCYYTMNLITEIVIRSLGQSLPATLEEKKWLLLMAEWVRYIFYIIAASLKPEPEELSGS